MNKLVSFMTARKTFWVMLLLGIATAGIVFGPLTVA
jgi:hypothetical protein